MEPIWLLVGLVIGLFAGAGAMLFVSRMRQAGIENAEVARLRARLEAAESSARELAAAREDILALAKQGAGEELSQRGGELVELVKAHLNTAMQRSGADEEARKRAVAELVEPVTQTLGRLNERIERVDAAREQTATELTAQLRTVSSGQQEVSRTAAALERALRQPHVRGRWGELGLRQLAKLAGMSELCDFVEQAHLNDDGRVLRPDMVVRLPMDRIVVVDAKVPLAPFLDAMQAGDERSRVELLKRFAQAMRTHVRKLSDKAYAAQFSTSPDFVVMYVPGDHFLGGALEVDPGLLEDAFARQVHIATPATLLALLRTVAYAFGQQKVAEDAQAIAKLGRELYDRIGVLLSHIDKVSCCVNSLVKAQDALVGSVERRLRPAAQRFTELGVAGSEEQLPELRPVTAPARRVQAEVLPAGGAVHELSPPPSEEAA